MRTTLPTEIKTIDEAKKFLADLYNNGEHYHPEDPAEDCFDTSTEEDVQWCQQVNKLMRDIYALEGNHDSQNMVFDPCGYLLELDGHVIE